jgi:radical SAM protein with 4Fe4S-binding SPASM domain
MKDFIIVFNPDIPNLMVVDQFGKELIELCNGNRGFNQITEVISRKYRLEKEAVNQVKNFLLSLAKSGFLSFEPSLPKVEKPEFHEKLEILFLHLTDGCNLRCKHCYLSAETPHENELSTEEFQNILKDFVKLGGRSLVITGGEPLLRRTTLYELIEEAENQKIKEVIINTNGTLITKKDIEFFKHFDIKIAISLDAATKEIHDSIRGSGSFEKTMDAINLLSVANIPTMLGMTLMKPNIDEIKKYFKFAKQHGITQLSFNIIKIEGRAQRNIEELAISIEDAIEAVRTIKECSKLFSIKTSLEEFMLQLEASFRRDACGAGSSLLSIGANGNVHPCDAFYRKIVAGNVREKRLKNIWRDSNILKTLRKLSVLDIPGCRNCNLKFICGGGCIQEIFEAYGGFDGPNPYCTFYKTLSWDLIEELSLKLWQELKNDYEENKQ